MNDSRIPNMSSYEQLMALANDLASKAPLDHVSVDQTPLYKLVDAFVDSGLSDAVKQACWHPNSILAGRMARQVADAAITADRKGSAFRLDLFVMPIILVIGAQKRNTISTVLNDVAALTGILESLGVLGHCKNFGLANCLTDYEALHQYPLDSWRLAGQYDELKNIVVLDFPDDPIDVLAGVEAAHLRFLCGVALSPTSAPSVFESAGDIGRWGIKFSEAVSAQLSTADCSLLTLPRLPRPLIRSLEEGYWAVREVGFQLFASNAINHARLKFGEPDISIDSSAGGKVLTRLSSLFDESFDRTYDFPVAPYESHDQALATIDQFFRDIGIQRYQLKVSEGEEKYVNCET
ncbi:MAG: hypothetical protein O3B03_01410 [Proteobacteria bacterium]|nr:hypothetical protein [Pseudomonadota bacterium]